MTKWKLVPVEPTPDMDNAARDWSLSKYGLGIGDDAAHGCYAAMLEAAPQPPKLSDERILEIAMSDDVSLVEYQGPGVRPRITVHNSIGGVYALARAIEREILGGYEK